MGSKEFIAKKTRELIDVVGVDNFIVNLGHGMWPDHDLEHLGVFVNETHVYS
jgi:uroporphyrinogen-III decarboxylase